jgi:hypothetical protein
MRGYKEHKGYATRLIFDAMKGQFVDMRVPILPEAGPEQSATVIELKRPMTVVQGPRSMRPLRQKSR